MIHDDRGLSPYAPIHIDWNGEMSATLTFSSEKLDEIMSELTGNEEGKDMNTEKLKDKIKKVIYVDKEMTVREPVLDSNGKPLGRGGKPVLRLNFTKVWLRWFGTVVLKLLLIQADSTDLTEKKVSRLVY